MTDVLISITYETWDDEAAEAGDTDDKGYESEDVPHTWREAIEVIRDGGFSESSGSPDNPWCYWLSDTGLSDINGDMYTGERTGRSMHFTRPDGQPLKPYQLRRLLKAAGVK